MKYEKTFSTPEFRKLKSIENSYSKKRLKGNINYQVNVNSINKDDSRPKLIGNKTLFYQKRNNHIYKKNELESRNLSPLLVKFNDLYSLLYKKKFSTLDFNNNKTKEKNNLKSNISTNNKNLNIEKEKKLSKFNLLNINRIEFPLTLVERNMKIKEKENILKKSKVDNLLYLNTSNETKNMKTTLFFPTGNNNNKEKLKYSQSFYNNLIRKYPKIQYENKILNNTKVNNIVNLPTIYTMRNTNEIKVNEYQNKSKMNEEKIIIKKSNENSEFVNQNNIRNSPLIIKNNGYDSIIIRKRNENTGFLNNNSHISNSNNDDLILINTIKKSSNRNKSKINTFRKDMNLCSFYELPPMNYYKEDFYYCNIYPSNCGWLIKECLKNRIKWKECHSKNTNLYNFKWKEVFGNDDFLDLSLNKTQIINHFEFHSCLSNKYKMFYNFSKYCEERNIDVFKYLPFTIILDLTNYEQFLINKDNFKKIFNNINDYLFDSNSINKKIFDRKKISYKTLFALKDIKIGNKIYCEIPKSHYTGKNLWIVKAPNLNRGRCVKVFNSYNDIISYIKKITEGKVEEYDFDEYKNDNNINIRIKNKKKENIISETIDENIRIQEEKEYKYQSSIIIIQKYIERPYLYKGRKCDIRIWVLITHKMEAYIFKEGHLKASSVNYDTETFDSFVHLTNYSLQKYNKNFSKFEKGNEISFKNFQDFINEKEVSFNFREIIFPKFIEIVKHTVLCAKNKINLKSRKYCFEILGYDFMMDEDKNVYLIEINTNPGLEISSDLIGELVPRMIDNALLLTVDDLFPTEYINENKNEKGEYKSKYHVNGYTDEENMWQFVCDMKKNTDKGLLNSLSYNYKNSKKIKQRIKIKKIKNKK